MKKFSKIIKEGIEPNPGFNKDITEYLLPLRDEGFLIRCNQNEPITIGHIFTTKSKCKLATLEIDMDEMNENKNYIIEEIKNCFSHILSEFNIIVAYCSKSGGDMHLFFDGETIDFGVIEREFVNYRRHYRSNEKIKFYIGIAFLNNYLKN